MKYFKLIVEICLGGYKSIFLTSQSRDIEHSMMNDARIKGVRNSMLPLYFKFVLAVSILWEILTS